MVKLYQTDMAMSVVLPLPKAGDNRHRRQDWRSAHEPCRIDANSFALRSSALWSALVAVGLGILWDGAGCVT